MKILSQTDGWNGYHGTIGTPTNMFDCCGEPLFVGDVVATTVPGVDGKIAHCFGIDFVCEENPEIANWTNTKHKYVQGIAGVYDNIAFSALEEVEQGSDEWWEKLYSIVGEWAIFKVKDYSRLVVGEQVGFLKVINVEDKYEAA